MLKISSGKTAMIIMGVILTVVGLAIGVIGASILIEHNNKMSNYIEVVGTVIDYEVSYSSDGNDLLAAVAEYEVDGKFYEVVESSYSYPPSYEIGETVAIMYNPRQPSDAIFKKNTVSFVLIIVAAVCLVVGAPLLFVGIYKKKKHTY